MTDRRSRHVRRTIPWILVIFTAGTFVGSRLGGAAAPPAPVPARGVVSGPEVVVAPSDVALNPWLFDPVPSAAPTVRACDETAQMMAAMFSALANQALDNAGKDQGALAGVVASDRQAFTSYLGALGISPDDPQVAAMLRAAFPTASALPVTALGC
jgi:hypothetical protein